MNGLIAEDGSNGKNMKFYGSGISTLKEDEYVRSTPACRAENLNRQLSSALTREDENILSPPLHPKAKLIFDIHITKPVILKLLKELNPKKSSDPYGIWRCFLK